MWVQGDAEQFASIVRNCRTFGVAKPPKCVESKRVLPNGDRVIVMLWRNGSDPTGGKR